MIGLDQAGYILYIELIVLGTVKAVPVEPMNIYPVAVMKNASRVIAIHNHPSGRLIASEADKDITDRLIQVRHILNITFVDHLIISPISYISFKADGLMRELENSVKYVPNYLLVVQIRKEKLELAMVTALLDKDLSIEDIAEIMDMSNI